MYMDIKENNHQAFWMWGEKNKHFNFSKNSQQHGIGGIWSHITANTHFYLHICDVYMEWNDTTLKQVLRIHSLVYKQLTFKKIFILYTTNVISWEKDLLCKCYSKFPVSVLSLVIIKKIYGIQPQITAIF